MSAIAEPQEVDLDALQADVETKIRGLRDAIGRLSLDALSDGTVRAEMIDAEHQLAECQQELVHIGLARAEQERREVEARQKALGAQQRAAYKKARQLQPKRVRAAEAVDAAAKSFVDAISEFVGVCRDQQAALQSAGQPQQANVARAQPFLVEASLAKALSDARWQKRTTGLTFERLPLIPIAHQRKLAESDARPVEPEEK